MKIKAENKIYDKYTNAEIERRMNKTSKDCILDREFPESEDKMKIQAYDLKGNTFTKEVSIKKSPEQNPKSDKFGYYGEPVEFGYYGDIIDFGWPCEYYINSLKRKLPFKEDLCIDVGGLNHKGSPVYVSKNDLNYIFNNLELIPRK